MVRPFNGPTSTAFVSSRLTPNLGSIIPFIGAHASISTKRLSRRSFTALASNSSLNLSYNIADTHDLSGGGRHLVSSAGFIPWAKKGSTKLVGSIQYRSNSVLVDINGKMAANRQRKVKRTTVQNSCRIAQRRRLNEVNTNCARLAAMASNAALNGSAEQLVLCIP